MKIILALLFVACLAQAGQESKGGILVEVEKDGKLVYVPLEEALSFDSGTFYGIDDLSNEWEKIADFIGNYTWEKYGKEVLDYYNDNCNSDKMETNESELTEKCWAGYTQKGMKTMFGKRYPNCVKKTKK